MLKASSYLLPSVRAFNSHIAKQIEVSHLEWTSYQEIRNKAVTFFKHSDLRSSQTKSSLGEANGTRKIQGLENFCSDLEISEAF